MHFKPTLAIGVLVALMAGATGASAQTTFKWAHVYETSEPFHTESVWAAEEIARRTDGRYKIDVYPASQLGKEVDINQGSSSARSTSSYPARASPHVTSRASASPIIPISSAAPST